MQRRLRPEFCDPQDHNLLVSFLFYGSGLEWSCWVASSLQFLQACSLDP